VKEFEGNTEEMSIDFKNFKLDLEMLEAEKNVEVPGEKITSHLDEWEQEVKGTTN
jgi:hypothetical protein